MSRLLLEISGHPWCRVPQRIFAIDGHIWACSFSASLWFLECCRLHLITCQRFVSATIDGGALVSYFGRGNDGIPPLRPARESGKMTRTAMGSRHHLVLGANVDVGFVSDDQQIRSKFVETPTPRDLVDMVERFNLNSFFHSFSLHHDHDRHKLDHDHGYQ